MSTQTGINRLFLLCLAAALALLGGCGTLPRYGPGEPQAFTADQQDRVGSAVADKLVQLLGGPYHDRRLTADLNRLAGHLGPRPPVIAVADRSAAEFYPLPGARIVMTRGLLAGLRSGPELDALLKYAAQLAGQVYPEGMSRGMVETAGQVLAATDSIYDPDAAAIRLARQFAGDPCDRDCLAHAPGGPDAAAKTGQAALPDSVRRLGGLRPGFDLLASARHYEQLDNQGKAIATYLQAAAAAPDEPYILGTLGLAYLRAGQLQPARLHLQKAVELQPDYYRTLMGLGYLSLQQGRYGQANELLAESVRLLAVAENLYLLAEAREKSGDSKGAMALYRLVVEADRDGKLGKSAAARLAAATGAP